MKTLYVIRHAKSDWKDVSMSDFERPLKERGREEIAQAASLLAETGVKPGLVLSSPAVRALDTARVLAKRLGIDNRLRVENELYLPDFPVILKTVLNLDDTLDGVMIVGHEPSLSSLINHFLSHKLEGVTTSSITELRFDTASWKDIRAGNLTFGHHRNKHNWEGHSIH